MAVTSIESELYEAAAELEMETIAVLAAFWPDGSFSTPVHRSLHGWYACCRTGFGTIPQDEERAQDSNSGKMQPAPIALPPRLSTISTSVSQRYAA